MERNFSLKSQKLMLKYQKEEETGYIIYNKLAQKEKQPKNKEILLRMAVEEKEHANIWRRYTRQEVKVNKFKVGWYSFLGLIFGYTFVIRLMEKAEVLTMQEYRLFAEEVPELSRIIQQEQAHEDKLICLLQEERLKYIGAMVLGLNDALVELSGALAGFTFALANTKVIALAGIITGVSASFSMAASNYLAEKAEGKETALKSSFYTGIAYLVTVILLVCPYLFFPAQMYVGALLTMLTTVIFIIFVFNYYVAVAKCLPFWSRFREMTCISLGVALISFLIGLLAKYFLAVEL